MKTSFLIININFLYTDDKKSLTRCHISINLNEKGKEMEKIIVKGNDTESKILVGESLQNLKEYISNRKVFIVTDKNVFHLYGDRFQQYPFFVIGTGEGIKNLTTVEEIIGRLIEYEMDRHSLLIGIGGGIVTDITGFAASIYMRGISFGSVSTTLLAQVDAGVGGKTGVNYRHYKNMIGVFRQPEFVICDTDTLKTLDEREYLSGFAEVIKHGLIADSSLFDFLTGHLDDYYKRNQNYLIEIVKRNVQIKAAIVNQDEKETGERKKLNFGHTLGHGIENLGGYTHGEAVALGMNFASFLSYELGKLSFQQYETISQFLKKLNYPIKLQLDENEIFSTVLKDKKRDGDKIDFIVLNDIGSAEIYPVKIEILKGAIHDLCQHSGIK